MGALAAGFVGVVGGMFLGLVAAEGVILLLGLPENHAAVLSAFGAAVGIFGGIAWAGRQL